MSAISSFLLFLAVVCRCLGVQLPLSGRLDNDKTCTVFDGVPNYEKRIETGRSLLLESILCSS